MNIQQYRYIDAINRHRNISRAAKELFLSQPALTRSLNHLEEELGVKLFDRDVTPLRLTYAGEVFLKESKKILEIQDLLTQKMSAISKAESGRLVVAIPGERGAAYLPELLPRFEKLHPGIDVEVVEAYSGALERMMENNEVDIGLYTFPVASDAIDFRILTEEPMVIVAARDSAFASSFDLSENSLGTPYFITPDILEDTDFLIVREGSGMRRITEYILDRHAVHYRIRRQLIRHETIVRLASIGEGLAVTSTITPKRLHIEDRFAYFSLDNPATTRKIVAAFRKNRILPQYMQDFIELTKQIATTVPELIAPSVQVIPAKPKC
ncbi:MAG: LysR family transcriptional regulator [Clostridia bacterium]|nr:LysR family transcriptional regulator [Clostridia bacterium]